MYRVEKARIPDIPQIHKLINEYAGRGEMLARPLSELYEKVRDFFVIKDGDRVLGCAALGIMWSDLAEVKSLADERGATLREAATMRGVQRVAEATLVRGIYP